MQFTVNERKIKCEDIGSLIGDNADYEATFIFDEEWEGQAKTARFILKNRYVDVILEDDACVIPVEILKQGILAVGVYAEKITSTICEIPVKPSIKEKAGNVAAPTDDVYAQLLKQMKVLEQESVSKERISEALSVFMETDNTLMKSSEFNTMANAYLGENLIDNTESDLISSANLLNVPDNLSKTKYGVTVTANKSVITMSGTWSATWNEGIDLVTVTLPAGTYDVSVWNIANATDKSLISVTVYNGSAYLAGFALSATNHAYFKLTEEAECTFAVKCSVGFAEKGVSFGVMIVEGNIPPSEFEAYFEPYTETVKSIKGKLLEKSMNEMTTPCNFQRSKLFGKKIVLNGDSICYGVGSAGGFISIIAEQTGCIYDNNAVGGATVSYAEGSTAHIICNDVENMADDADLVCFEGGINDYWANRELGSCDTTSKTRFADEVDNTTFIGALESIFRQALEKWVGVPICYVITHSILNTGIEQNTVGYTCKDYHDAIVTVCNKYGIPYCDLFLESGMNTAIELYKDNFTIGSDGTPDGVHPNKAGYTKYYVPKIMDIFEKVIPL